MEDLRSREVDLTRHSDINSGIDGICPIIHPQIARFSRASAFASDWMARKIWPVSHSLKMFGLAGYVGGAKALGQE